MVVERCGGRGTDDEPVNACWRPPRVRATRLVGILLALLLPCAVSYGAVQKPIGNRPGNTSAKDLESGEVPLSPADLQFYLSIMRASVSRYEHPNTQDTADLAEDKRLSAIRMADQEKYLQDLRAGNTKKAFDVDLFRPTPAQEAAMRRGDDLRGGNMPSILAGNAGMGRDQWDNLSRAIDEVVKGPAGYGSGDEGPAPKVSAAQLAGAERINRARAANRKLVMPSAAEIKRLQARLGDLVVALRGK